MEMVIFDQVILIPTLGICGNYFLNQASWSFCIVCKTISKWSFWCWPTMQRHFQMLKIKRQSDNLLTDLRSPHNWNFTKQGPLCKPMPQRGVKYYWHHTHEIFWQNSNQKLLQPFHQTGGGQNQIQTSIQCCIDF